ncbi:hypothetical protein ACHAO4_008770 [Trichoderma viride]
MEKFLYQYLEYLAHFKCPLPPTSTIIQEKQSDDSEETIQWTSDLSDTESSADNTHSDDVGQHAPAEMTTDAGNDENVTDGMRSDDGKKTGALFRENIGSGS